MNKSLRLSLIAATLSLPAFAASAGQAAQLQQRDVHQEQRIASGLRSDRLTANEAGRLQQSASRIDYLQSRAMSDGRISGSEAARIDHAQDAQGRMITQQLTDRQTGNSNSYASRAMQADVARNVDQEQRILAGTRSGGLTNVEASRLEYGQAASSWYTARAQATGGINPYEQMRIQRGDAYNSASIYDQNHDGQVRPQDRGWWGWW